MLTPGRQQVAADLQRRGQVAADRGDDRAQAQRLLDRRLEVGAGVLPLAPLGAQALDHGRVADQALQGPAQRRRRRLVAGQQQGHQLVAQLEVGQRLAVLVAGLQQHREDVVVAARVGLGAAGVRSPRRRPGRPRRRAG